MGNYVERTIEGKVKLKSEVTEEDISRIFDETDGYWFFEPGVLVYSFFNEGNYTTRGPDHEAMIDRIIELGYNSAAWRESCHGDSDNGGGFSSSEIRGTPEQCRELRLEDVNREIAELEEERRKLLAS